MSTMSLYCCAPLNKQVASGQLCQPQLHISLHMAAHPHPHSYVLISGTIISALNHKLLLWCLHLTQWIPFVKQSHTLYQKKMPPMDLPSTSKLLRLPVVQPVTGLTTHHKTHQQTSWPGGTPCEEGRTDWGSSPDSLASVASLILDFVIVLLITLRTCSLGRHKHLPLP